MVFIGHSERRKLFGDTDEWINKKLGAALKAGLTPLTPIVCGGETLEERESQKTWRVLETQIAGGLKGFAPADLSEVFVAYEPVWAIGTGKTASPAQAQEARLFIRAQLAKIHGEGFASGCRILYGGSVNAENVDSLMAQADVDGALVGGASLKRTGNSFVAALRIAVIFVFSAATTALADSVRPSIQQAPDAFFAVHFEPRSADARGFAKLGELMKLADVFKVKLTLQFTPSWARMILADPGRVAALRRWQASGHEVAMHHHGALHGWEWDGYTDLSVPEWNQARQTVYGRSGPQEREIQGMARSQGFGESYFGTMLDYMVLLRKLGGRVPVLTMTMGPDRRSDWPPEVPYSDDNITIMPDGSYAITGGAVSRPEERTYSGRTVREVGMRFIVSPADVELAKTENARAATGDIVGVVTHIEDFAGNPGIVREWMRFLQEKDPRGRRNRTISEIMRAR